jgi:hypothetical protein
MRVHENLRPLKLILAIGGGLAVLIGLSLIFFGTAFVPGAGTVSRTVDSEFRFYATLFVAYGGVLLWCLVGTAGQHRVIMVLAGVLFAGGLARLCSMLAVGLPHPFFMAMTLLELALPPVMILLLRREPGAV